jgi:hypothetical protein
MGSPSRERERERERERDREQRDVVVTEGTQAGGEAPEKEALHERDARKQLLRRGRKVLGLASTLASTLEQTDQSLNATWADGTLPMRLKRPSRSHHTRSVNASGQAAPLGGVADKIYILKPEF